MPYSGKGGSVFVNEMRSRLEQYYEIALRSVRDSVPKTIGYFLVRKSESVLHMELYNAVNHPDQKMISFLGEPPQIAERRKGLNEILETLRKAVRVLERDPDIATNTVGDPELENEIRRQQQENMRAEE
jgi:dynamin 1-like protein